MKAFMVIYEGELFPFTASQDFVFANTTKRAKSKFLSGKSAFNGIEDCYDKEEIELQRCKELDSCESLSTKDIVKRLITVFGWVWEVNDNQYTKENFNEKDFSKDWSKEYG
ncbi:MAG: hypothetical protein [Bacteriophage sp.]|nr:MAG: hypothetical protein [Bacteriophage sp.]